MEDTNTDEATTLRPPGMPEKIERNREIYFKKCKGLTYRALQDEYNLSVTSLQRIVNRMRKRGQKTIKVL